MDMKSLIEAFRTTTDWRTWGPGIAMLCILIILCLRDTISNRKPVLTGKGTVSGRGVVPSQVRTGMFGRDGHNYQLTFQLSDGEELTLFAPEKAYLHLKDGTQGQLTWQGDTLRAFQPGG